MAKKLNITIADACICIEDDVPQNSWEVAPSYRPFVRTGQPDISLRLHSRMPDTLDGKEIFDSPPIWTLYRRNGTSVIKIFHDLSGQERTLVLSPNSDQADLYFTGQADRFQDPFYGPGMELLMINYLAQGKGAILHACGVEHHGKGILFVGESGAGKSTMADLWKHAGDVTILSDDRAIARQKDGQFRIHGTPWHGEAKFGSPRSARLDKIFFIRHGRRHSTKRIQGIAPVQQLLTGSFPPFWDARGMAFTLDFFNELAATVPCYELRFRPDMDAVDFIKSHSSAI